MSDWISAACQVASDIQEVYNRYEEFKEKMGSTMALDTYKRRVRYAFYDVSGKQRKSIASPRVMVEADGPNMTITATSSQIRTLEELIAYVKADMSQWYVKKWIANPWGNPENENFQVKAWFEAREPEVDPRVEIEEMIEEASEYMPVYPTWSPVPRPQTGNMLEIALFDHHFGQLSWGRETRSGNYDTEIARRLAFQAVDYMLSRSQEVPVDKILLTIGNDFFNVNSQANETVAGTPQSEDGRWQKSFVRGRKLWVEIIERCLTVAPVDIIGVSGNHDGERSFYLVDSLACWFSNHPDVLVDNGPALRKYYQWGKCLIGYTHGDRHGERRGKAILVNLMATEQPVAWAETKFREWHKGHFHATSASATQFLDEELGVRERVMPSLVAIDDYHDKKGYSHLRESMGLIWNTERGNTDIFMYHPE